MPVCSACNQDLPKGAFSNSQLKLRGTRRCKQCVAQGEGNAPKSPPCAAVRGAPSANAPAVFADAPLAADERLTSVPGIPWPLLPCELGFAPLLRAFADADGPDGPAASDAALINVLRAHPFVNAHGRANDAPPLDLGDGLGLVRETHYRLNINAFRKWLKLPEGEPFAREAGGPSDDGMYTLSAVLRRCMPRGLSHFVFEGARNAEVIIRGFRKFTGLTAEDEDEQSGATGRKEAFFFSRGAAAARFAVTTKSNGENGKFGVRRVGGQLLLFGGSKNTCHVWRCNQDVRALHPPAADGSVPGPLICAEGQRLWRALSDAGRAAFVAKLGGSTLMLEYNCASSESRTRNLLIPRAQPADQEIDTESCCRCGARARLPDRRRLRRVRGGARRRRAAAAAAAGVRAARRVRPAARALRGEPAASTRPPCHRQRACQLS